jgi:hypothetical protein
VPTFKKNTETSQISNLMMHLKLLEKEEQTELQTSRLSGKKRSGLRLMSSRQKSQYEESMKQNGGSLKRLTKSRNP